MEDVRRRETTSDELGVSDSMSRKLQLQALIQVLSQSVPNTTLSLAARLEKHGDDLRQIRRLLIDSPIATTEKDDFRRAGGFEVVLDVLGSFSGFLASNQLLDNESALFFEMLKCLLDVLAETLSEHSGNMAYFTSRIPGGGWNMLQEALEATGVGAGQDSLNKQSEMLNRAQMFGLLFAFALREESFTSMFRSAIAVTSVESDGVIQTSHKPLSNNGSIDLHSLAMKVVHRAFNSCEILWLPDIVPVIFHFWLLFALTEQDETLNVKYGITNKVLSLSIIYCLIEINSSSEYNAAAMYKTGLQKQLLNIVLEDRDQSGTHSILWKLVLEMTKLGIADLDDVSRLFQVSSKSNEACKILVEAIRLSKASPHFLFDLSLHGYASLEISDLQQPFPPEGSSTGYTVMCWARFDTFDSTCHTTIFGAFDQTQTCFLLFYLEKESHQLVLQTSLSSPRPSVRFKSATLKKDSWYHIALVHERPRSELVSRVSLYINGSFREQVKCRYPESAPFSVSKKLISAPLPPSLKSRLPIQVFFGTPQDLSPRLGRGVLTSKWALASAFLFSRALPEDLIFVYQKLGPSYYGNFQDCLGSFQTYHASATLNLRNEVLHFGEEEKSLIFRAVRFSAGDLNPEENVLIGVYPALNLSEDLRLARSRDRIGKFSNKTLRNFMKQTQQGVNIITINSATPSISIALSRPSGSAILTGGIVEFKPASLDSRIWRVNGCVGAGLKLVEVATTDDSIMRAVAIVFDLVRDNWRNSEAMERENGFGILSWLLRSKIVLGSHHHLPERTRVASQRPDAQDGSLTTRLLQLVLGFVGYGQTSRESSIIINPLAYRVLLIDFDIWRRSDIVTQKLYYDQFITFALRSRYRDFNAKRLSRMRVIKKFIESFKSEEAEESILPVKLYAFKILVENLMSSDILRSVALYITFSLHDHELSQNTFPSTTSTYVSKTGPSSMSHNPEDAIDLAQKRRQQTKQCVTSLESGIKVLELFTEILSEAGADNNNIKKFAKSVTNKWLLHLFAEPDGRIIISAMRILARLLTIHGAPYVSKFEEKTHGFIILSARLRTFWNLPDIWSICFAVLFGLDIVELDIDHVFDPEQIWATLRSNGKTEIFCPAICMVMTTLLEEGLKATAPGSQHPSLETTEGVSRRNTLSTADGVSLLRSVFDLFQLLNRESQPFKDFSNDSKLTKDLLKLLQVVELKGPGDIVDQELELRLSQTNLRQMASSPAQSFAENASPLEANVNDIPSNATNQRNFPRRRGSSFVMVPSRRGLSRKDRVDLLLPLRPISSLPISSLLQHPLKSKINDAIVTMFLDQILGRNDFSGLGLFIKSPSGTLEETSYLLSNLTRRTLSALVVELQQNLAAFWEVRNLLNLAKFASQTSEAVYEGWFVNGAEPLLNFIGNLLEYLHQPEIKSIKSVRWSAPALSTLQTTFRKTLMFYLLSNNDIPVDQATHESFLRQLQRWVPFSMLSENDDDTLIPALCYLLYDRICQSVSTVAAAYAALWQSIVQKRIHEVSAFLTETSIDTLQLAVADLTRHLAGDASEFVSWIDQNQAELDIIFSGATGRALAQFIREENITAQRSATTRTSKRNERLEQGHLDDLAIQHAWTEHEIGTRHWIENIHSSELLKHNRAKQDQQDNFHFLASLYDRMSSQTERLNDLRGSGKKLKWQLDNVEGRDRIRCRLATVENDSEMMYRPKRAASQRVANPQRSTYTAQETRRASGVAKPANTALATALPTVEEQAINAHGRRSKEPGHRRSSAEAELTPLGNGEEGFEMIAKPATDDDDLEDKNRKVMRSLRRGEQVQDVINVSRIRGLEACEGLLIVGKNSLYLLDNLFQRTDGEIVGIAQAPKDERDHYVQMISGRRTSEQKGRLGTGHGEAQYWSWTEIISISKRHFLLRDVALEAFFDDGRSYLLTTSTKKLRDDLYARLDRKVQEAKTQSPGHIDEAAWRIDLLRNPRDTTQTLGSKFVSVFSQASPIPATKRWLKGEMSNFQYLMLINTMAGRTFNDLTQYPVFPWVLADYKSTELDLTNPRTFRDLAKPMGCQTPEREAAFRRRYQSFAEIVDHPDPAFHYGTHYTSAMIVTSYMIRLQPFVHSNLLLQGGSFDHADRLFYSVEKAWQSASNENMTDVRELTPEFYYLPEFLKNINGYDFGIREGTGERINDVELPPWAHGDPLVFITKHREALESPHVSQHLHEWIDLIFGFKQRGEAAVESTNVFHHLSYHGAKDLDSIEDPLERLSTIGIINNFGQTPRQVFVRPHERREDVSTKVGHLVRSIESLKKASSLLFDISEPIMGLWIAPKQQRVLCAGPFRTFMPPYYNVFVEWGHTDGSMRFYAATQKKGVFEQLHQEQVSTAVFADSKTLVTASEDCTVAIWTLSVHGDTFSLQPKSCLFGHRSPVTHLALSRSFSTLLSASADGHVILWDLNRLEALRIIHQGPRVDAARINDQNGHVILCCGPRIFVYTLNGQLMVSQTLCTFEDDFLSSCAFYEPSGNEWLGCELIFTGHKRGIVNVWNLVITREGKYHLDLVHRMDLFEHTRGNATANVVPVAVTAVLPTDSAVYTGCEDGKVFQWDYTR